MITSTGRRLFNSILCPVDFSSQSRQALRYAAEIARRSGASLSAVFVNDPVLAEAAAAAYDERELAQRSERELRLFVGRVVGPKAKKGVSYSVFLGDPPTEIVKLARRGRTDLVVLGTQGLSGASRLFFGSTTQRVLRKASTPVLAIPPNGKGAVGARWPGRRLVAAVDLGPQATADARRAADVAQWFGVDMVLVHVVSPTRAPHWMNTGLRAHDRSRLAHARTRLGHIRAGIRQTVGVTCHVLVGHPAEQIPAIADDVGAGLVVATLRMRDGFFGAPRGSITHQVLCSAGVPVLALPPGWRPAGTARTSPETSART
jgi:nucleotide-binding universal stress UspA family protein